MERNLQLKLILVGDTAVGKSCIHHQLTDKTFKPIYNSTIGVDYNSFIVKKNAYNLKLQIWDTAGQEMFHSIVRSYFRNTIGAIVVYDITDINSFNSVREWIREVKQFCSPNVIISLVGNKIDLEGKRQVPIELASNFAREQEVNFYEVSAKNHRQIVDLFTNIANGIYDKYIQNRDLDQLPEGITVATHSIIEIEKIENKKGYCCILG